MFVLTRVFEMKRWMGKGLLKLYHSASDYLLQMHGFFEGMEPILTRSSQNLVKAILDLVLFYPADMLSCFTVCSCQYVVNTLLQTFSNNPKKLSARHSQTPHNEMSLFQGGKVKFKTRLQFCYC